ncbi:helix-turn-helix domain-containing protein [Pseudovibrio flavus]|uniref:helix-turn-helix domain-containing protein n=1 Tax=Pseudovibrio flavus TaxID=2529854 RepID=UPI00211B8204|nr:AraC family transcriptional regulator [Pseudovibrio flavus]
MSRISAYRLKHVAKIYEAEKGAAMPFSQLLEEAGLSEDILEGEDARIPLLAEATVLELCCEVLGDKTFGARAGLLAPGSKTLMAYLASASGTLGQVVEFAQRFYALEDPDMTFSVRDYDGQPFIELGSDAVSAHKYARHREFLLFGLYQRTRQIAGPDLQPFKLFLETRDEGHCNQLSKLLGFSIECGQPYSGLLLPKDALDYPIPTSDGALLGHLLEHGEERLRQMPKVEEGLSEKVLKIVRAQLPGTLPNGDEVADVLCMTRRTLSRRLSSEGTSFKGLVELARCDLAKRLLLRGDRPAQVAYALGFADQAAFTVAFKRWTGTTPASFKRNKS